MLKNMHSFCHLLVLCGHCLPYIACPIASICCENIALDCSPYIACPIASICCEFVALHHMPPFFSDFILHMFQKKIELLLFLLLSIINITKPRHKRIKTQTLKRKCQLNKSSWNHRILTLFHLLKMNQ